MAGSLKSGRGGDIAAPSAPRTGNQPDRTSRKRLVLLLVLLAIVVVGAVVARGQDLRLWWLDRQSTKALEERATPSSSGLLARYAYANRLLKEGRGPEALDAFLRAEGALPPGANDRTAEQILAHCGYLLVRYGRDQEAVPYLDRARKIDEDDPLVHVGYGMVFDVRQMATFAQTEYRLATELDPQNVEAWYRLGKACIASQNARQAVDPLKRAVQLAPNDAASHADLGEAYARQSQFDQALPEIRRAAELDPGNMDYQAMLANAEAASARTPDQFRAAAERIRTVLKSRPDDTGLLFTLAGLYQRSGEMERAREQLLTCIRLLPSHAEAWYNLSMVDQRLGNDAEAKEANAKFQHLTELHDQAVVGEKRVSSDPKNAQLRVQLAAAYRRAGNNVGTYWQLNTANLLKPNDPTIQKQMKEAAAALNADKASHRDIEFRPGGRNTPGPPPPPELISVGRGGSARP